MERNAVRRLGPSITTARKLNVGGGPSNYQPGVTVATSGVARSPSERAAQSDSAEPLFNLRSLSGANLRLGPSRKSS
jgi:hypothetical protein